MFRLCSRGRIYGSLRGLRLSGRRLPLCCSGSRATSGCLLRVADCDVAVEGPGGADGPLCADAGCGGLEEGLDFLEREEVVAWWVGLAGGVVLGTRLRRRLDTNGTHSILVYSTAAPTCSVPCAPSSALCPLSSARRHTCKCKLRQYQPVQVVWQVRILQDLFRPRYVLLDLSHLGRKL
jgi:hypothetical protein